MQTGKYTLMDYVVYERELQDTRDVALKAGIRRGMLNMLYYMERVSLGELDPRVVTIEDISTQDKGRLVLALNRLLPETAPADMCETTAPHVVHQ